MSRRSIHQFKDTPVTDEQIKTILAAAMQAPSAGDGRPWHLVVTKDREKLDALAEKVDGGNNMMYLPLDKIMQSQQNVPVPQYNRGLTPLKQVPLDQGQNSSVNSSSSRTDRFSRGGN